jgi:SEC-C motif
MFPKHRRLARALWSERLVTEGEPALDDLPDEQELAELKGTFGRWHTKLWCGLTIRELVEAIEPAWEDPKELRSFYRVAHTDHNETTHTTALSFASPVITDDDEGFEVDSGRSLQYVARGLVARFWTYSHLLRLAADYFEIDGRERVAAMRASGMVLIAPLNDADAKDAGRNDLCPCGSGVKFERCHGT